MNDLKTPTIRDCILWIEGLVIQHGVEIDYWAWNEIKKHLKYVIKDPKDFYYESPEPLKYIDENDL